MFSCIMLCFWQIGIFWEKNTVIKYLNSTCYEKGHLNFLEILCMPLQKFWNMIWEFIRNYSQMQVKRNTHLPLAVRGHYFIFEGNKSSNLSSLPSIFQLPEIMAIEIIIIWVSSWQNNPKQFGLWKTNQIMFKNFSSELVFLYWDKYFFFLFCAPFPCL